LLDEDVDPAPEQRLGDLPVVDGGHGDARRADPTHDAGGVGERLAAVLGGDRPGTLEVAVANGDEPRAGERGPDPRVVAPEVPDSDDGDGDRILRAHRVTPRLLVRTKSRKYRISSRCPSSDSTRATASSRSRRERKSVM